METNEINNSQLKKKIADNIVLLLLNKNLITQDELTGLKVEYGYVFNKVNGVLEALMKVMYSNKVSYFAIQNNSLMLIDINEEMYNQTISYMESTHECLKSIPDNESDKQKARKQKNNQFITQKGITINENLSCKDDNVQLKNIDDICKRAVASLLTIQIACDINTGKYKESLQFFSPLIDKYGVRGYLNSKEKRIIDGTYSRQDAIDMDWAYEAYWAVCWCLSLVDDIKDASVLCDCGKAISFVQTSASVEDFKNKCKLRSIDEILDMLDLYYRYNWAINHKKVDPNTNIGNLNPSNVIERRRGLEWVVSSYNDWYDIPLDA